MIAVFKRNFAAYFLNPTGYVFICVFVLLGSIAAFLPDDFVNSNLANLAQLNRWFPLIMLIFIPAITMGTWADERRFGTEELLLTSPLSAGQIILGKYAAAVGIYSVSLLFSFGSNYAILAFLGQPDFGLFLATYFGYWLIGLLMLAFGTAASLLTSQLTVAYILGGLLNVPLIALAWADAAPFSRPVVNFLQATSIDSFFQPFGRGTVTLSGISYFVLIPVVVLVFCLAKVTARWWTARRPFYYGGHYAFQIAALAVFAGSILGILRQHDFRSDWTAEKLGSLSVEGLELIDRLQADRPVVIEAWLSERVPPEFAQTRLDIIAVLNEIKSRLGDRVYLSVRSIDPNTPDAYRLERQYDIRPKKVVFDSRGQVREESIFLTVLFRCGPKTIAIPFLNRGLSVEYELISSLVNVGDRPKKRLGIVKTDASLFGRRDRFGEFATKPWPIVDELARQYLVEEVDAAEPIPTDRFDAILAVQPSSLSPTEMVHLAAFIRDGKPTLLFEDPFPLFVADFLAGTKIPKRPNPALGVFPGPKGEVEQLWAMLGILFGNDVLWKNYNPYPKLAGLSEEFLFVDSRPITVGSEDSSDVSVEENEKVTKPNARRRTPKSERAEWSFAPDEPAVASLDHLLFPFVGSIIPDPTAGTEIKPLVQTEAGGIAEVNNLLSLGIRSRAMKRTDRSGVYLLAAAISGEIPRMFRDPNAKTIPRLNVVLVADVDLLTPGFFTIREMGTDVQSGVRLDFDNVPFVLNLIDRLAGDDPLIALRSRRARHRRLTAIEDATRQIRDRAARDQIALMKEFEAGRIKEEDDINRKINETINRRGSGDQNRKLSGEESQEIQAEILAMRQRLTRLYDEKKEEYDRKVEESGREVNEFVRKIQGRYKLGAVLLPPIPPLLIGLIVWGWRRINRRKDRRQ